MIKKLSVLGKEALIPPPEPHFQDSLLRGFSFQELVDVVVSNEPGKDEATVKKVFQELVSKSLQNARFELKQAMPRILKEIQK